MSPQKKLRSFRDYVTVKTAAEFLVVSVKTLCNGDHASKLRASRHPVDGYRRYDPRALEVLLLTAAQ